MPVGEVLARTSSYELSEWMVYERMYGPIGESWRDELMASMHEQLQFSNHLTGAIIASKSKGGQNKVPKVQDYPRPWKAEMERELKER